MGDSVNLADFSTVTCMMSP